MITADLIDASTTRYVVNFFIEFLALLPGYAFFLGCYFLWWQTSKFGWGHRLFGKLAIIALFIANVLYTYDATHLSAVLHQGEIIKYGPRFRPFVNTTMTMWVFYNVWFFDRNKRTYLSLIDPYHAHDDEPVYIPASWLTKFLMKPVKTRPPWFSKTARWTLGGIFFMLVCFYFVGKLATLAVWSDQRVINATKEFDKKAQVFEKKVEKRVTEAVAVAVDTLQQGQDQANAKADTAFKVAKALGKQVNENTNDLIVTKSRTRKVEAKADRALNSVTSPGKVNAKQIPSLSTSPRMNGKKVSQNEGEYTSDELATHY